MENPQTEFVCGFFVMMKSIMCLTKVIVYDNIVTRKGSD